MKDVDGVFGASAPATIDTSAPAAAVAAGAPTKVEAGPPAAPSPEPITEATLEAVPEGSVVVLSLGNNQVQRFRRMPGGFVLEESVNEPHLVLWSAEDIRSFVIGGNSKGWTLTIEAAPRSSDPVPATPDRSKQYENIEIGQVWTREISTSGGNAIESVEILHISGDIVFVKRSIDGKPMPAGDPDMSLEDLQKELRDGLFLPEEREPATPATLEIALPGAGEEWTYRTSEGDFVAIKRLAGGQFELVNISPTGARENEMSLTEAAIRDMARDEEWERAEVPQQPAGVEAKEPQGVKELREALNEQRAEYVRIEAEQAKQVSALKKIFRQLTGHEGEIAPELERAQREYYLALVTLQGAEMNDIKQSGLRGGELVERLRTFVSNHHDREMEYLDKERRAQQYGEGQQALREKWGKLWEESKRTGDIVNAYDGVTRTHEWHDGMKLFIGGMKLAPETLYHGMEAVGKKYNEMVNTRTKRILAASVGVGMAGVAVFGTGGAAAGWALAGLALKRAVGGAGVMVAANEGGAAATAWLRQRKTNKLADKIVGDEQGDDLKQKLSEPATETPRPEGYLQFSLTDEGVERILVELREKSTKDLLRRTGRKQLADTTRKWAAFALGVTVGSGAAADMVKWGVGKFGFSPAAAATVEQDRNNGAGGPGRPDVAARAPAPAGSAASAAEGTQPGAPATPTSGAAAAEQQPYPRTTPAGTDPAAVKAGSPAAATAEAPRAASVKNILDARVIQRGDTISKYAIGAAQAAGLGNVEQQRFATLLRDGINAKLASMEYSGKTLREAGFVIDQYGHLSADYIQANRTLNLGKLFTETELQALLDQAKQPIAGGAVAEAATGGKVYLNLEDAALDAVKQGAKLGGAVAAELTPSGRAADIALEASAQAARDGMGTPASAATATVEATSSGANWVEGLKAGKPEGYAQYLKHLPQSEQIKMHRSSLNGMYELLRTRDVTLDRYDMQYDPSINAALAKTPMANALNDFAGFQKNPLYQYNMQVNPLHYSQMRELYQVHEGVVKAFGEKAAQPLRDETMQSYLFRATALAKATGVKVPGLRVID